MSLLACQGQPELINLWIDIAFFARRSCGHYIDPWYPFSPFDLLHTLIVCDEGSRVEVIRRGKL